MAVLLDVSSVVCLVGCMIVGCFVYWVFGRMIAEYWVVCLIEHFVGWLNLLVG